MSEVATATLRSSGGRKSAVNPSRALRSARRQISGSGTVRRTHHASNAGATPIANSTLQP